MSKGGRSGVVDWPAEIYLLCTCRRLGFVDIARVSPQQRNARPGSSDRSLGSTRSPKLSSAIRTARYHSLATSHCPAAIRLHLTPKPEPRSPVILQHLVDRQFDEIHLQPATHPRAHQFRNTSNLFYGFSGISSDHHQCFMLHCLLVSRPKRETQKHKLERGKEAGPWQPLDSVTLIPVDIDVVPPVLLLAACSLLFTVWNPVLSSPVRSWGPSPPRFASTRLDHPITSSLLHHGHTANPDSTASAEIWQ